MADSNPNSFDAFAAAVRSSCDQHAKRKNYSDNGTDGHNRMISVMVEMGIHAPHCVGEIVYKCAEYLRTPRRVLLEKVAGWAYVLWKETPPDA